MNKTLPKHAKKDESILGGLQDRVTELSSRFENNPQCS